MCLIGQKVPDGTGQNGGISLALLVKSIRGLFSVEGVAALAWGGCQVASGYSGDGSSYTAHRVDLDLSHATFCRPDLDSLRRLDRLGLSVAGQMAHDDRSVLACQAFGADDGCRGCGCRGVPRDTVLRKLAHVPLGRRRFCMRVAPVTRSKGSGVCRARARAYSLRSSKAPEHRVRWRATPLGRRPPEASTDASWPPTGSPPIAPRRKQHSPTSLTP